MTSLSENTVVTTSGGLVELGYQSTDRTNLTLAGTSTATAAELVNTTVVCDGSPVILEFQCGVSGSSSEYWSFGIWIDGVYSSGSDFEGNMQVSGRVPSSQWKRLTPSAGVHTFSIRWWRWSGSTFTTYITGNCVLRVNKIIQASQFIVPLASAPLVTSLPSAPIDGQEIRYVADATNGVIWNLRYRAASSSSYKWEFIGGSPYRVGTTSSEATSSTTYTTLASGPQILIPLAGDYSVYTECQMASVSTGSGAMAYDVGATPANDIDAIWSQVSGPGYSNTGSVIRTKTISTAGTILTMKYKSPQSVSVFFGYRYFQITPIRVG